jgi:F-type H+-transporting ATPase subunit epsilon
MPSTFPLTIATQQGPAFIGEVASLRAPGVVGSFGVLPRHAPMIAQLGVGQITLTLPDKKKRILATSGGICEISETGVVILVDACEAAEAIDPARAEAAAQRARERLAEARKDRKIDATRAEMALLRALNRLRITEKRRHA